MNDVSEPPGDVDWADFVVFHDYLLGPSVEPELSGWRFYDVDVDDDLDLRNVAAWHNVFTGDRPSPAAGSRMK